MSYKFVHSFDIQKISRVKREGGGDARNPSFASV